MFWKSLINVQKNEFEVEKFWFFVFRHPTYPIDSRLRDILFLCIVAPTYTFHLRPKWTKSTYPFFCYSHLKFAIWGSPLREYSFFTSKPHPILMKLSDIIYILIILLFLLKKFDLKWNFVENWQEMGFRVFETK